MNTYWVSIKTKVEHPPNARHRIQFYPVDTINGTTIAGTTNFAGSNASLLAYPLSLVLDTQLNLYVSDYINHQILKFMRY